MNLLASGGLYSCWFVSGVLLAVWSQFYFSIDGIHGCPPILSRSKRVATGDGVLAHDDVALFLALFVRSFGSCVNTVHVNL
jgi:hypothetical protein